MRVPILLREEPFAWSPSLSLLYPIFFPVFFPVFFRLVSGRRDGTKKILELRATGLMDVLRRNARRHDDDRYRTSRSGSGGRTSSKDAGVISHRLTYVDRFRRCRPALHALHARPCRGILDRAREFAVKGSYLYVEFVSQCFKRDFIYYRLLRFQSIRGNVLLRTPVSCV